MKSTRKYYETVHEENIPTGCGIATMRIRAVTDPEKYRLAKLNNTPTVKIERKIGNSRYETLQKCENLSTANEVFGEYREMMKGGKMPQYGVILFDV